MENKKEYKKRIALNSPPSPLRKNIPMAFLVGGGICVAGEGLRYLFERLGISQEDSYLWVTVSIIFISATLTALGVFDKIAKHAGAGTLVPVSGFANSVVCSALDTRAEGFFFGVGAKIFIIAGPVILFTTVGGILFGLIYYIISLF